MCSACVAVEITKKPNESALCSGVAEGRESKGQSPKSKVQSPTSKVIAATVLPQDRTERSEAQDQGAESRGQKSDDRSLSCFSCISWFHFPNSAGNHFCAIFRCSTLRFPLFSRVFAVPGTNRYTPG